MKRTLIAVAAAGIMAVSAAGAAGAAPPGAGEARGRSATAPNCEQGLTRARAASQNRSDQARARLAANLARCQADDATAPKAKKAR